MKKESVMKLKTGQIIFNYKTLEILAFHKQMDFLRVIITAKHWVKLSGLNLALIVIFFIAISVTLSYLIIYCLQLIVY